MYPICLKGQLKTILKNLGTPDRGSNHNLPVINSIIYCDGDPLYNVDTEAGKWTSVSGQACPGVIYCDREWAGVSSEWASVSSEWASVSSEWAGVSSVWLTEDAELLFTVMFSDEANFYVSDEVNRQNMRYLSQQNTNWFMDSKQQGTERIMSVVVCYQRTFLPPASLTYTFTLVDGPKRNDVAIRELITARELIAQPVFRQSIVGALLWNDVAIVVLEVLNDELSVVVTPIMRHEEV
uniref:Uncharacterized protein n=1 Tax=Timema bartmani TaxID=61472 RepID=A0A7R9EU64_9NEOP|nr:unnamed protein product [Timema bartmani]